MAVISFSRCAVRRSRWPGRLSYLVGATCAALAARSAGLEGVLIYARLTSADGAIWAYDTASGNDRFLTWGARPVLSPNGQWLAFWREFRDGNPLQNYGNLFVRDLATGAETRIYVNGSQANGAAFLADGEHLLFDLDGLFRLRRDGTELGRFGAADPWDDGPAFDPLTGRVCVFNVLRGPLAIFDPDGSNRRELTSNGQDDWWPTWSPDGQWIAALNGEVYPGFHGPWNLFKVRPDGTERLPLTALTEANDGFRYNVVWTRDGSQLLAPGWIGGTNALYTVDPGGAGITGQVPLPAGDPIIWVAGAANSADLRFGSGDVLVPGSIVYSRSTEAEGSIWVFDPSTGRDRYLFAGTRPRLSPDGRYLVFLRDNGARASRGNVYVRDLREGTERRVYENHDYVVGATFADDGREVLFDAVCSIFHIPRWGSTPAPLVGGSCWDDAPAADPLTGRVAFHNFALRQTGMVNADGGDKHYLPPSTGEDAFPAWSPDGQWIVVANADSIQLQRGPGNLIKFRPDGSERTALTTTGSDQEGFRANAIWTLDGRQILGAGRPADRNGIFRVDASGGGILERLETLPGDEIDWVGGIVPGDQTMRGLVAWWRAEGSVTDSAGENHGAAIPLVTYAAQGKVGQAFDFSGGAHLEIPDAPSLHVLRFTATAWVNFRSVAHAQTILSKATQDHAPESLALWYGDGQLRGRAGGSSVDVPAVEAPFHPAPGAWHHVAYRFDGSNHTLFLDGAPVATAAGKTFAPYTTAPLLIGARDLDGAAADTFDGLLDEVRLYRRALSDSEIVQLRRLDHTRIQASFDPHLPEPLALSWPADDHAVLVETVPSLGEVETWLPIEQRPIQVGSTQILHLPLSGLLGDGNTRFWRTTLLQEGVQLLPVTLTVRNLEDSFAGSLRQAIQDAHSGDVIVFARGLTGTIKLTSGQLVINKSLKIIGPGAGMLTISGGYRDRVFRIDSAASVTLSGLTVAEGLHDEAAGILAHGSLALVNCVVRNNTALALNYGPGGGGILAFGGCLLRNCTIVHNDAHVGGGVAAFGGLTIENCTVAENRAAEYGGGIYSDVGDASVSSTTVSGNQAIKAGGGFFTGTCASCPRPKLANNLIAGNTDSAGAPDCQGEFTSLGYNLVGMADGSLGWGAPGDQVGSIANPLAPKLGPLQDNGGPTPTMAPLPGSKAIDQGRRNGLSTDQRGRPRPKDQSAVPNANYGDGSDIGAVEVQ